MNQILKTINAAILSIRPNANFHIRTVDYFENPEDCIIWHENNTLSKPSWLEVEQVLKDNIDSVNAFFLEPIKDRKIAQCKAYLTSTDWQIIRFADPTSGEALKEGVAEKRDLARNLQTEINACTTLEELNAININFE